MKVIVFQNLIARLTGDDDTVKGEHILNTKWNTIVHLLLNLNFLAKPL